MIYDPERHHRRSIRLKGYDYSRAGAYFLTVGTRKRVCLFGDVVDGEMRLNEYGNVVTGEWVETAEIRHEIELDAWIVMPNHFHGIVLILNEGRGDRPVAPTAGPQPRSLGALMAGFKSAVTKRINDMRRTPGVSIWQRNYYEHIIRNDESLNRIRAYILNNPLQWESDPENPDAGTGRSPLPKDQP